MAGCGEAKSSVSMEDEAYVEKFGGITPKKPLISKDHERAYFDSADWVLGKQAANSSSRPAVEGRRTTSFPLASPPAHLAETQRDYVAAAAAAAGEKLQGRGQQRSD
ncbi:hypothetical protein ACQ4PT_021446 [Festuca glaucescens]